MRAAHILAALGERTHADVLHSWGRRGLPELAWRLALASAAWLRPAQFASAQLLPRTGLALVGGRVRARVLDLHDHPRLQREALGISVSERERRLLDDLTNRNVGAFEVLAVPSASFAELCGLSPTQTVVATNGTDTAHIVPGAYPSRPAVGFVSGAAPGRGIERLVEVVRGMRSEIPDLRLRLALQGTGPASNSYLHGLRQMGDEGWLTISQVPYADLPRFLADTTVMAIPHPPDAYLDVATPVKLFDSMAAGRPVVVTPRIETARIVRDHEAGLVADGDSADDLASVLHRLLVDGSLRSRLGENARRAAVNVFDWRLIAASVADATLAQRA